MNIPKVWSYNYFLFFLLHIINTLVVKVLGTPVGGQGGIPMDPNSENAFPEGIFWPNSVYIKTTLKHLY